MTSYAGKTCKFFFLKKARSESLPKQPHCSVSSGLLLAMPGCGLKIMNDLWGQETWSPGCTHIRVITLLFKVAHVVTPVPGAGFSLAMVTWHDSTWQQPTCHSLFGMVSSAPLVCGIMVTNWDAFPVLLAACMQELFRKDSFRVKAGD